MSQESCVFLRWDLEQEREGRRQVAFIGRQFRGEGGGVQPRDKSDKKLGNLPSVEGGVGVGQGCEMK